MSFPATHLSLVRRVRSNDADTRARAQDALAAVYWAPIYAHVRLTHRQEPADAEDLTQGFFVDALRRDLFARYDPERARFRTFVRRCVDSYVVNALQAERRLKRGGGASFVPIDVADIETRLTIERDDDASDPDVLFHREWVRSVLVAAIATLHDRYQAAGRGVVAGDLHAGVPQELLQVVTDRHLRLLQGHPRDLDPTVGRAERHLPAWLDEVHPVDGVGRRFLR